MVLIKANVSFMLSKERMEWVSLESRIKNGVDSLRLLYSMDTLEPYRLIKRKWLSLV